MIKEFVMKHIKRGFKYALVGAAGTLINLTILYLLTENLKIWYIGSEVFAILCSFLFNYFLNTYWTYRDAMKTLSERSK